MAFGGGAVGVAVYQAAELYEVFGVHDCITWIRCRFSAGLMRPKTPMPT